MADDSKRRNRWILIGAIAATFVLAALLISVGVFVWLLGEPARYVASVRDKVTSHRAQYTGVANQVTRVAASSETTGTIPAPPAGYRFLRYDGVLRVVSIPTADRWMTSDGTVQAERHSGEGYWIEFPQSSGILGQQTLLVYSPDSPDVPSPDLRNSFGEVTPLVSGWFLVQDD